MTEKDFKILREGTIDGEIQFTGIVDETQRVLEGKREFFRINAEKYAGLTPGELMGVMAALVCVGIQYGKKLREIEELEMVGLLEDVRTGREK